MKNRSEAIKIKIRRKKRSSIKSKSPNKSPKKNSVNKKYNKTQRKYNMIGFGSVLTAFRGGAIEIEQQHSQLEKKYNYVICLINDYENELQNENLPEEEKTEINKILKGLNKKKQEYINRKDEAIKKMCSLTNGLINIAENAKNDLLENTD